MGDAVRWPSTRAMLNPRAGRAGFEYFQCPVAEDLAWFVGYYWIVVWDRRGQEPHRQRVLPHPAVQMTMMAGRRRVAGVIRGQFSEVLRDAGHAVGVAFRPGGFRPLLGAPVSTITDRFLPIAAVFGAAVDAAAERIVTGGTGLPPAELAARAARSADALLRRLAPPPDPAVAEAAGIVAAIAADPALTRVPAVAAAAGLAPRTLQRLFREYVGVGPKWVIRRYRMHEAAQRAIEGGPAAGSGGYGPAARSGGHGPAAGSGGHGLATGGGKDGPAAGGGTDGPAVEGGRRGPVDWARVAAELGYADQAHFTRDFTATVGMPPTRYARECQPD